MSTPFNVIVVRSFSYSKDPLPADPKEKKYISSSMSPHSGKPITEENALKAEELRKTIQSMGPFEKVFCSESKTSQQTASILSGYQEDNASFKIERGFNQIVLADLDGVEAGVIQELYQIAHPRATFIPEPNDAMNDEWPLFPIANLQDKSPALLRVLYKLTNKDVPEEIDFSKVEWPAELKINFEPFSAVDKRVCQAFRNLGALDTNNQKIPTFLVVASKDPIRSIIMHSSVSDKLKNSKFYAELVAYLQREPKPNVPFKEFSVRAHFDPKEGSILKFHCDAKGEISLEDVSENVEFRAKVPVAGYTKQATK